MGRSWRAMLFMLKVQRGHIFGCMTGLRLTEFKEQTPGQSLQAIPRYILDVVFLAVRF